MSSSTLYLLWEIFVAAADCRSKTGAYHNRTSPGSCRNNNGGCWRNTSEAFWWAVLVSKSDSGPLLDPLYLVPKLIWDCFLLLDLGESIIDISSIVLFTWSTHVINFNPFHCSEHIWLQILHHGGLGFYHSKTCNWCHCASPLQLQHFTFVCISHTGKIKLHTYIFSSNISSNLSVLMLWNYTGTQNADGEHVQANYFRWIHTKSDSYMG